MWTEEKPTFQGKYYSINGPINEPKGVQRPHIPLWIGGGGEKVTLKLVAKFGDACNVGGGKIEVVREKLPILRKHCEEVGRDYNSLIRSTNATVVLLENGQSPEQGTARVRGKQSHEDYLKDKFV